VTYVVSFVDFRPEPRFDNVSWTQVQIQEAATELGPFTLIDTLAVGSDPDPAHPAPRSFTTNNATLQSGWYTIIFLDATGFDRSPVAPVHMDTTGSPYLPSIQQVARKILSRTRDQYGNVQGTFNGTTTPTDQQTQDIINDVVSEVADVIGDDIPPALYDDAANVVAIRAAMQIELDFFPDQVNTGRSIYPQLLAQYNSAISVLQRAVTNAQNGDGTVTNAAGAMAPSYSFPTGPMIGLDTVW
jgi:hypothetical protein